MICPCCCNNSLQENSLKDKVNCVKCRKVFELTEVNAWFKNTVVESCDIEYDKGGI